jgi:hypothetical protein
MQVNAEVVIGSIVVRDVAVVYAIPQTYSSRVVTSGILNREPGYIHIIGGYRKYMVV